MHPTVTSRARPCFGTLVTISVCSPPESALDPDVATRDCSSQDLPTQDLPTQDLPTQDLPTQDLPTQDWLTQGPPTSSDSRAHTPATRAIDAAFEVCAHIHCAASAHDPSSDPGRIARAQAGERLKVSGHTVRLIALARHWHRQSGGRFDPSVGAQLAARGLRPGLLASARGRLSDIRIEDDRHLTVMKPASLDFGGLAKGYAVDRAIDCLRARGVASALVNAGGDLRGFGAHRWPLALRAAAYPTRLRRLGALCGEFALASSAQWFSDERGARPRTALVTPQSRRQLPQANRGCTVWARDAASADALTKIVLLAPHASKRLLNQSGARAWVY